MDNEQLALQKAIDWLEQVEYWIAKNPPGPEFKITATSTPEQIT